MCFGSRILGWRGYAHGRATYGNDWFTRSNDPDRDISVAHFILSKVRIVG